MNKKTTLILFLLTAGLFAYIWLFETDPVNNNRPDNISKHLLPSLDPIMVQSLQVKTEDFEFRIDKEDGTWYLTSPVHYPAETSRIETILDQLRNLESKAVNLEKNASRASEELKNTGLDKPRFEITLQQGNETWNLMIGKATVAGDMVYAGFRDRAEIYIVPQEFLRFLPKNANSWRSLKLISSRRTEFNQIKADTPSGNIHFLYDESLRSWKMSSPVSSRAHFESVEFLAQFLTTEYIREFVNDDPTTDLAEFGLSPAKGKLELFRDDNALEWLEFGNLKPDNEQEIYCRRSGLNAVLSMPASLFKYLQTDAERFRDPHIASFHPADVQSIEIQSGETFSMSQTGGKWTVEAKQSFPGDEDTIAGFLIQLTQLKIREFVKDSVSDYTPYGLHDPQGRIILKLKNVDGTELERIINVGSEVPDRKDQIYVGNNADDNVYAVRQSELGQLPVRSVLFRLNKSWQFGPDDVEKITIRQQERRLSYVRIAKDQWRRGGNLPGLEPNGAALDESVLRIGNQPDAGNMIVRWVAYGGKTLLDDLGFTETAFELEFKIKNVSDPFKFYISFPTDTPPLAAFELKRESWWIGEISPSAFHMISKYLQIDSQIRH